MTSRETETRAVPEDIVPIVRQVGVMNQSQILQYLPVLLRHRFPSSRGVASLKVHEYGCFASSVIDTLAEHAMGMHDGAFTHTPEARKELDRLKRAMASAHNVVLKASRKSGPCPGVGRRETKRRGPRRPGVLRRMRSRYSQYAATRRRRRAARTRQTRGRRTSPVTS